MELEIREFTLVKEVFIVEPRFWTARMMTAAMRAMSTPYSTAEAPSVPKTSLLINRFTRCRPCWPNTATGIRDILSPIRFIGQIA
jgi:hypothetical protein